MNTVDHLTMRALGRRLADTFAEGWSKGKPELLMSVFSESATFIETPFSTPITGTTALRRWAGDIPYNQSEITFAVGEILVAGPWFSTEFKLTFRRRRTGDWIDARGALFAETDGAVMTELRMYWHRSSRDPRD